MPHYVTTSTKPEVHNVIVLSSYEDRVTAERTCTENFVKFGHVVVEICKRTDRQTTDRRADHNTSLGLVQCIAESRHSEFGVVFLMHGNSY